MARAGRAWRGWFPLGGELTSGVPDGKEGIYFGEELPPSDRLLHGPNLFPERPAELRAAVLDWMAAMTGLGHVLMGGLALGLGLERDWIDRHLTADPVTLFRIFRYPPVDAGRARSLGRGRAHRLRAARRSSPTTARRAWRSAPATAGRRSSRSRAASCATSATCWSG